MVAGVLLLVGSTALLQPVQRGWSRGVVHLPCALHCPPRAPQLRARASHELEMNAASMNAASADGALLSEGLSKASHANGTINASSLTHALSHASPDASANASAASAASASAAKPSQKKDVKKKGLLEVFKPLPLTPRIADSALYDPNPLRSNWERFKLRWLKPEVPLTPRA